MITSKNHCVLYHPTPRVGIRNISDYSPFGVLLPERTVEGAFFRRGFQGQERDDEIKGEGNSVNYKYRMHDPRVGRFFAVDPLIAKYSYYSAYQFSSNSPIIAIELEGAESSVQLNFTEGSIVIKRNVNGKLSVTRSDLYGFGQGGWDRGLGQGQNRWTWISPDLNNSGYPLTNEVTGMEDQIVVWCEDCASDHNDPRKKSGSRVVLTLPKQPVVSSEIIEVEVPVIVEGDPGIPARNDIRIRSEDWNIVTDDVIGSLNGFVANDAIPDPGWDSREILSINLVYFTGTSLDPSKIKSNFESAFGVPVTLTPSPKRITHSKSSGSVFDWQAITTYRETRTIPGTSATPDTIIMQKVERTVEVTTPAVIITP